MDIHNGEYYNTENLRKSGPRTNQHGVPLQESMSSIPTLRIPGILEMGPIFAKKYRVPSPPSIVDLSVLPLTHPPFSMETSEVPPLDTLFQEMEER